MFDTTFLDSMHYTLRVSGLQFAYWMRNIENQDPEKGDGWNQHFDDMENVWQPHSAYNVSTNLKFISWEM